ncbi:hypothetical protein HD806DRAFT_108103 [Xylariaceae sp. AK1471]|nr:hypothetical protein HD806DRAFT_108103 [Xylariaceae sp. AK1471]
MTYYCLAALYFVYASAVVVNSLKGWSDDQLISHPYYAQCLDARSLMVTAIILRYSSLAKNLSNAAFMRMQDLYNYTETIRPVL